MQESSLRFSGGRCSQECFFSPKACVLDITATFTFKFITVQFRARNFFQYWYCTAESNISDETAKTDISCCTDDRA